MKTLFPALAAATLLTTATGASAATVVNFNELAHDSGQTSYGGRVESGGMTVQHSTNAANGYIVYGRNDGRNSDPGNAALMSNLQNTSSRVSRTDHSLFDLVSLDMADVFNTGQLTWVKFDFLGADGALTSEIRSLDTLKGQQTLVFDKTRLRSFDYAFLTNYTPGSPGWGQIDNITYSLSSAVPEPASWALMIAGFGGAGAMLRRRRTALSAA